MVQESFPMIVGGDEVLNERDLLTRVENGLMMNGADSVRFIVIHCSATRRDQDYPVEQLLRDHKARGFRTIGYHFYIRQDGTLTRQLDELGKPADTRTPQQKQALRELLEKLHRLFPDALIVGHRDLPGVHKACPCFDVRWEYKYIL